MLKKTLILASLFAVLVGATLAQDDLPIAEVAYEADFTDADQWAAGSAADDEMTWQPSENGFSLVSANGESPVRYAPGTAFTADNFYAEVNFTLDTCTSDDSAFVFNMRTDPAASTPTEADGYAFVLQCSGDYRARLVNAGRSGPIDISDVLPEYPSEGDTRTLGVLAAGDQFTWFLDGVEIADYVGGVNRTDGLFAFGGQLGIAYTVNSFTVWNLDAAFVGELSEPAPAPAPPTASLGEDPLAATIAGRNVVVEDFNGSPNPLLDDWTADLVGYDVSGFVVTATDEPQIVRYLSEPVPANYDIFAVETTFLIRHCESDSAFGIALGANETDFTAVRIQCNGQLSVDRYVGGVLSETLLSETFEAVRPFQMGTVLSVVVSGETLTVYYNAEVVGEVTVPDAAAAQLGLLWQAGAVGEFFEVAVDAFVVNERLPQ